MHAIHFKRKANKWPHLGLKREKERKDESTRYTNFIVNKLFYQNCFQSNKNIVLQLLSVDLCILIITKVKEKLMAYAEV